MKVSIKEREYLRSLAGKVASYAALPVMAERRKLWYEHNAGRTTMPPIIVETASFFCELAGEA